MIAVKVVVNDSMVDVVEIVVAFVVVVEGEQQPWVVYDCRVEVAAARAVPVVVEIACHRPSLPVASSYSALEAWKSMPNSSSWLACSWHLGGI